jgi:cytidylate kinase
VTPKPALTISRSLGSGGTEVGFLVAQRLGWHYCDRRILRLAAEATGHSITGLARQEERKSGFLDQLKFALALGSPEAPYTPLLEMPIYSRDLFALERDLMFKMLEHAPSVILGRGGFFALQGRPATLHVRIHAAPAFRCQSLVQRGKAPDLEAAKEAIARSDRDRAAFIRDISGLDWQDPRNFQLVLDVSHSGLEACVERILAMLPAAGDMNEDPST